MVIGQQQKRVPLKRPDHLDQKEPVAKPNPLGRKTMVVGGGVAAGAGASTNRGKAYTPFSHIFVICKSN